MSILRPRVWTQQPQFAVEIDWSNPLTRGLVIAIANPFDPRELTGFSTSVKNGMILPTARRYGVASNFSNNASNYLSFLSLPTFNSGDAYTVAAICAQNSSGTGVYPLTNDDGTIRAFQFRIFALQPQFVVFNTSVSAFVASAPNVAVGEDVFIVGRVAGTSVDVWSKGVKGTPATLSGTIKAPAVSAMRVGVRTSSASDGFIGPVLMWHRALTDVEVDQLSANPWQIFRPRVT